MGWFSCYWPRDGEPVESDPWEKSIITLTPSGWAGPISRSNVVQPLWSSRRKNPRHFLSSYSMIWCRGPKPWPFPEEVVVSPSYVIVHCAHAYITILYLELSTTKLTHPVMC